MIQSGPANVNEDMNAAHQVLGVPNVPAWLLPGTGQTRASTERVVAKRSMAFRHARPGVMPLNEGPDHADGTPDFAALMRAVAARGHDARASYATIFAYYAPRVKSFMMRSGVAAELAEELAQETLLTVWRKAALFDAAKAGASAWIFTIARNRRIDALRRDQRGYRIARLLDEDAPEPEQPDQALSDIQTAQQMRDAMQALPKEQAEVIRLSFFDDKSHADIAQMLGLPLGTVKSRARLALQRLRAAWQGLRDDLRDDVRSERS